MKKRKMHVRIFSLLLCIILLLYFLKCQQNMFLQITKSPLNDNHTALKVFKLIKNEPVLEVRLG